MCIRDRGFTALFDHGEPDACTAGIVRTAEKHRTDDRAAKGSWLSERSFQQGGNVKLSAPPKKLSNFVKGKAPMPQDNEGYILYPVGYPEDKIRKIHSRKSHSGPNHAFYV